MPDASEREREAQRGLIYALETSVTLDKLEDVLGLDRDSALEDTAEAYESIFHARGVQEGRAAAFAEVRGVVEAERLLPHGKGGSVEDVSYDEAVDDILAQLDRLSGEQTL